MVSRAPLTVPALTKHTATVIWAHGLGDTGAGWAPVVQNWRMRRRFPECKFVFPNAPEIPITVNFGMSMPGWYDIMAFDSLAEAHDQPGIVKSRDYFQGLVQAEIDQGIPSNRIIIGGFSQGGAISIFAGITSPLTLGGIFGLSSYMLLHDRIKDYVAPANATNRQVPIFMGHGDADPLVKYTWGVETADLLRQMGWKVQLNTYAGLAHSADPKEIEDLGRYIELQLAEKS